MFGTPHGVDLATLCAATSTPYVRAGSREELRGSLLPGGLYVVEVRTDRGHAVDVDHRLRKAVAATLR